MIYGYLSDAHGLWTAGLKPQDWEAIGATVFFLSIGFMLYRHHQKVAALLSPPQEERRSVGPPREPALPIPALTTPDEVRLPAPTPERAVVVSTPAEEPHIAPTIAAFKTWISESKDAREKLWNDIEAAYDQWREAQSVTLPKLERQIHDTQLIAGMNIDGETKQPLATYFPDHLRDEFQTFRFAQSIYPPRKRSATLPEIDAQRRDLVEQWKAWGLKAYLGEGLKYWDIRREVSDCRDQLVLLMNLECARYLQVGFRGKPKAGLLYLAKGGHL